jgi:hypothetical protein
LLVQLLMSVESINLFLLKPYLISLDMGQVYHL